ncbi:MAG: DUF4360 domain-containing protein [Micromonosporaceae bacterium]|nr:DUF4360 domain-containing protein [Micromonosporaceae bacterium]
MMYVLATVAVAVSTIISPVSAASELDLVAPPTEKVVVEVATVNGSGCPAGTAEVTVSPDNASFEVGYSDYIAQVGAGAKPTDVRKNCQLSLRVATPTGFTFAITRATYQGSVNLASGATAVQNANYYIQGESETATVSHPFAGPLKEEWQTADTIATVSLSAEDFVPCGEQRNFNVNTELRVNAGTSDSETTSSSIAMDSASGHVSTVYHFAWMQCK